MNIVTISREFGSGGRALGKKISEILNYDYYDREIITEISRRHDIDEHYVEHALTNHAWQTYSLSFSHSFMLPVYINTPDTKLLKEQRLVIEEIAQQKRNCIIVGRTADVLLQDYAPLNLFICADLEDKIKRCQDRAEGDEKNMTYKQFKKKILSIDKNRARTRFLIADGEWGDRKAYHLIVNTTGWDLDELAYSIADFIQRWFKNKENSNF